MANVYMPLQLAPGSLTQPILPDWSFNLFSVNLGATSNAEVEHRVLDQVGSYGKQIGHLAKALEVVIQKLQLLERTDLSQGDRDAVQVFLGEVAAVRKLKAGIRRVPPAAASASLTRQQRAVSGSAVGVGAKRKRPLHLGFATAVKWRQTPLHMRRSAPGAAPAARIRRRPHAMRLIGNNASKGQTPHELEFPDTVKTDFVPHALIRQPVCRSPHMTHPAKNTICLWYDRDAEAAARFYAETFPDSCVQAVHLAPADNPSCKEGDVLTVEFTVLDIPCLGLNGGPAFKHNEAFSFQIATTDQVETDRYWNAIVNNGGQESACGWCKDKWGISWQITPIVLTEAYTNPDRAKAKRAFDAMLTMKKIDVAAIEAAMRG